MHDAGPARTVAPLQAHRETVIAACVFALVTAAFYHRPLFFQEAFFSRDILPLFHPFREIIHRRILEGDVPLWNPNIFGGLPLVGYLVVGPLYPLNLILVPFESVFAITLSVVIHHFLAALGMWLFLRRFGVGLRAGIGAAVAYGFCGYIVSADSDTVFVYGMTWLPWIGWALDRTFEERTLGSRVRLALLFAMQILCGDVQMVVVTGAVCLLLVAVRRETSTPVLRIGELAISFLLATGLSAVQLLPFLDLARESLRWGGLSESEAWLWSFHPARIVELFTPCPFGTVVGGGPFWGAALVTPPRDIPWSHGLYLGVSVLFCGVFARRLHHRLALALWITGAAALLLAMGHHAAFLSRCLRQLLPLWSSFRYPEKWLALTSFCLVAAGGLGAQGLMLSAKNGGEPTNGVVPVNVPRRFGARPLYLAVSLTLVALAAWGSLFLYRETISLVVGEVIRAGGRGDVSVVEAMEVLRRSLGWPLLLLSSIGLLLYLQRRGRLSPVAVAYLWMSILLFDVVAANLPLVNTTNRRLYDQPVPFIEAIRKAARQERPFRVYSVNREFATTFAIPREELNVRARAWHRLSLFPNTAMTAGLFLATGYPSILADFDQVWRTAAPHPDRLLKMMGIRFVVDSVAQPAYPNTKRMRPILELRPVNLRLLEMTDPAPLARIVHQVRRVRRWKGVIEALDNPEFDVMTEVILQEETFRSRTTGTVEPAGAGSETRSQRFTASSSEREPEAGSGGRFSRRDAEESARIVVYRPEEVVVEAKLQTEGYLVLADRYDPGWRATVDGEPRPLLRANGMQRAVRLEPGHHRIAFRYSPPSVRLGTAATLSTLMALALLWVRSLRNRHKHCNGSRR